jgi:hypothetical protein
VPRRSRLVAQVSKGARPIPACVAGILGAFSLVLVVTSAQAAPEADTATPFSVRDQNPLLAGFGLPVAIPSRVPELGTANLDFFWGSTALAQRQGSETILLDAETREARLTLQGSISTRLGWQVQVPYRYTGGGNLDGFIDSWHDIFGLSEGVRPLLPHDQIYIVYARSDVRQLEINSSTTGIGDLQAALGYSLHASAGSAIMAWLSIELPTGDEAKLTGNGATDVSLILSAQHKLNDRWSAFGQLSSTWLGDSDLLPAVEQKSVAWSAMAGISARAGQRLSLKAQIDAHTAVFDSDLDILSEAVILTLGGEYRFDSGWRLDVGVSEDIAVEHSPDVVFVLGFKRGW